MGRMAVDGRIAPDPRERFTFRGDRAVAQLAAGQWGVVSTAELRACGLTRTAITRRRERGHLHQLYVGVWAVGHPNPPWEGRLAAAVKACGPAAILSHYTAAEFWGFVGRMTRMPDVTVPSANRRRGRGIRVHRSDLAPEDRREHLGVAVTAPARTLLDLAALVDATHLRRAVRGAIGSGSVTHRQLQRVLRRYPRRRGSVALATPITSGAAPTNSERESDVLDLILDAASSIRTSTARCGLRVDGWSPTSAGPISVWSWRSTATPGTTIHLLVPAIASARHYSSVTARPSFARTGAMRCSARSS